MMSEAPKVKTKSLLVPQLKSTCLHSRLTWLTNDPTSYSRWFNIIGYWNKTQQKKSLASSLPNFFWFYLVTSDKDAYGKCNKVKVSVLFGKCSEVKVKDFRNGISKVQTSKKLLFLYSTVQ